MEKTPYFHALAVFACKANRLYRVYVRPEDLVFIWADAGTEGLRGVQAAGSQGGLVPALIGMALKSALDPAKKNALRGEVLDSTPLERLIGDNAKNMRAPIGEFTEVRIAKRSDRHARVTSDHGHQALLYLRHETLGKYLFAIATAADVRIAMKELPLVLGSVYKSEIEPPEHDQKCGCPYCKR